MPLREPPETNYRETGAGSVSNPLIMWNCHVTRDMERTNGCEVVTKEGCIIANTGFAWIRHVDHDTTRTRSRSGRRLVRTDPHITVYLSQTDARFELEGHLFLTYDPRKLPQKVPKRLATRRELRYHRGLNPELYQRVPRRGPIRFSRMPAS
ncbi:hypothetical protein F5X97DRAFT_291784 [Nemania serpens]|nr:hypothetical protein F5X97DRAFT_291784 [Nemania serpens]